MDITDELRAFVATAQTGSFTAAANQIGVSNRLTSKYVAQLEARLGVRLLQRTTRTVGLTQAGEDLLARAPALLEDLDDLLAGVAENSQGLSGMIRVAAPVTFGEVHIGAMLGRFAQEHPGLSFDVRLHDGFVDLAGEGIDLAFRIGHPEMLSLKARKMGEVRSVLVASPAYIAAHGDPARPDDLTGHSCIVDTNRRAPRRWVLYRNDEEFVANIRGRFQVNSARAASELAIAGLGIAYVPHFAIYDALGGGDLVEVMPGFTGSTAPLNAVYLEGRAVPRKIRALIDFAKKDIAAARIL
ncbi:LysR family transcriptional regulator [Paracoccus albus]|uniref:LysR family transcriptional regulator n=1 Tax=Paracoccus albus TaxID=3017784 RepID=UPI0022F12191|nr:LysR family transcriptional regulator [Paracoccus albus]WBU59289.1 LysR family transcriptional regulator [Paracoccus albus]